MTDLIDSHAHVWDRSCRMVQGARYHPQYEATIDAYLRVLDAHGIDRAVLVQPSFLGTDNRYLLACIRAHPDRLRGIVVLDPDAPDAELEDMTAAGVIGHRYNMVGREAAVLATDPYRGLSQRTAQLGWWTEVQAEGTDWPVIISALDGTDARLMVDHFGLPSGPDCSGIAVLQNAGFADISLKLSAPYRQRSPDFLAAVRAWIHADNAPQVLWASDWPWTQHEGQHRYEDCIGWLDDWVVEVGHDCLAAAPAALTF